MFFLILFFSLLPASYAILIDDSKILKNGYFFLNDEKVFISNFEVREFEFNPIIRISGLTTSGMSFYIVENSQTGIIHGFVMTPNEIMKFQFKDSAIIENTDEENIQSIKTNLNYLVSYYNRLYNNDVFKFSVKTFDKSLYDGTIFDTNFGKLNGVKIQAIILDKDGNTMEKFNGITKNGIFEESIFITDNLWPRGTYFLNLELEYDGKSYQDTKEFFVLGDRPDHD